MNRLQHYLLITSLCFSAVAQAQPAAITTVPFTPQTAWQVGDSLHQFGFHKNKQALMMQQGTTLLGGVELRDGIIEVDIAPVADRSFAGVCFRAKDDEALELIYLRFHKSGQFDAIQYTPRYNGLDSWQLYHSSDYQGAATYKPGEWNRLKIKFEGSRAWVGINEGAKIALHVPQLVRAPRKGKVGLWALGEVWFSNFSYSSLPSVVLMAEVAQPDQRAKSIINWELSPAYNADSLDWKKYPEGAINWQAIRANDGGLVNVSAYRRKRIFDQFEKNSFDVVFARTTIVAEKDEMRAITFDYSDQAQVFLNGKPLFRGDNTFRSKGPLYRGEVYADNNVLYLPLKKGNNELLVAVAERANGWGYVFQWE
ncbi:MAG: family 16 glycoside hydrolase [Saprospiraceae bacterium]